MLYTGIFGRSGSGGRAFHWTEFVGKGILDRSSLEEADMKRRLQSSQWADVQREMISQDSVGPTERRLLSAHLKNTHLIEQTMGRH